MRELLLREYRKGFGLGGFIGLTLGLFWNTVIHFIGGLIWA